MEKLKNFAAGLRQKFKKSDVEKLLEQAISQNDLPLRSIYTDLSEKLQSPESMKIALRVINENLTPTNKDIDRVLKTLLLCEALCSIASSFFKAELKSSVVKIKLLSEYRAEEKPQEQIGLVRETARSLLKLLNEETCASPAQSTSKEAVEENPSNWYESAKVNINDSAYPDGLNHLDKSLFVRNLPEAKPDLFAGLRFKNERPKQEEKSENLGNKEKSGNSLFGVPMKPRFIKKEETVFFKENEGNGNKDFPKETVFKENEGNGNKDLLSLLNLDFREELKSEKVEEKEVKKKENSNTEVKTQMDLGSLSSGYNNLGFDEEFPIVIGKAEAKAEKNHFNRLEDSLINLDGLDLSLSQSKVKGRGRIFTNY